MTPSALATFLRSLSLDGWAESAEHIEGARRIVEGMR
jgi:hypothetical protein